MNIDITPILASATILTLVVGLALQETAGNLVSGMLMLIDKPFAKGDKVIVKGVKGKVVDVGIMTTKIRTGNERMVIIPNTSLSGQFVGRGCNLPISQSIPEAQAGHSTSGSKALPR